MTLMAHTPCDYCGIDEAMMTMDSPNGPDDDKPIWNVCKNCNEIIKEQKNLAFAHMLSAMDTPLAKEFGKEKIKEINERIAKLENGKPTLSMVLRRKNEEAVEDCDVKRSN